jgi:hypothetical protein
MLRWIANLLRRRYRQVADLHDIGEGRVEIVGTIEALDLLHDPLTGDPCVAMEYRAWAPSTTVGLDGAVDGGRAYQIAARQAVDFVLQGGGSRVLVRPVAGDDVLEVHRALLRRFGVGLRAEVELVPAGASVRVMGRVMHRLGETGSPMRTEPWAAVVSAERVFVA